MSKNRPLCWTQHAANPNDFDNNVKWDDWYPTFANCIRLIPGRDGVPLSYVIRDNAEPDPTPQEDYLDEYVNMALLGGSTYINDNQKVFVLLNKFIVGNDRAEAAVKALNTRTDGRMVYFAIKKHFEGEGMMQLKVQKAEAIIKNLFYSGEKKPHMWWQKFEQDLQGAYATLDKHEG